MKKIFWRLFKFRYIYGNKRKYNKKFQWVEEEYYKAEEQTCILTYLTFVIYKKEVKFPKTRQKEINEEIQYEVEEPESIYVFDVSKTRTE